jgi:MoaA/NifB/PqqE/SkfB family radical SAM enzyme
VIEVSLHGATAETHDRQTRVPGSFVRLLENLPQVKACGLRVKLNGTLTAWNEHELEEMFELSERIGIPLALTATVTPRDDGDLSPLDIAPSRAGVERMYRFLSARAASAAPAAGVGASSGTCAPAMQTDKNCGAGSSAIAVDPFGNVYPCVQWRRRIGNLHQSRLMEIWQRSSALAEVRAITVEAKRIKDGLGPAGRRISFCPGISEEKTGNPLAVDQAALDQALVYHEVDQSLAVASLPVVY